MQKIISKILASQQYIKRMIYHYQERFNSEIQNWFNIQKSINIIHYIAKL